MFIMMTARQLFQKFSDFFSSHTICQCIGNNIFCLFTIQLCCNLFVSISLFLFELGDLFIEFFQLRLFCFTLGVQCSDIITNSCNLLSNRFCGSILFSDLCYVIDTIENLCFILASFRTCHTLIVATVTTRTEKKKNQPTHVLVDSNPAFEEPSMILLEQIFTIDKSRIERFMGYASKAEMLRIDMALLVSLALNVLSGNRSE